jgi:hypothetical protein
VGLVARAYALSSPIYLSFCLSLRSRAAESNYRAVLGPKLGAGKGFSGAGRAGEGCRDLGFGTDSKLQRSSSSGTRR